MIPLLPIAATTNEDTLLAAARSPRLARRDPVGDLSPFRAHGGTIGVTTSTAGTGGCRGRAP